MRQGPLVRLGLVDMDPVLLQKSLRHFSPSNEIWNSYAPTTAFSDSAAMLTIRSISVSAITSGGAKNMQSPIAGCAPPDARVRVTNPRWNISDCRRDAIFRSARDLTAAKLFLRLALSGSGGVRPRVVNVDGHPAYARAIAELKDSRDLGRRCRCRRLPYLNNIIEQDHRFIKKRITASLGFRSPEGAWRTIEGYEAMHMIRKGQVRWLDKGDVIGQRQFIHNLFGIAA